MTKKLKLIYVKPVRDTFGVQPEYGRTLRIRNTGKLFSVSHEEWKILRHTHWFLTDEGRLINKAGLYIEDYLAITRKTFSSSV